MKELKTTAPVYKNLGLDYMQFPNVDASSGSVYYGWAPPATDSSEKVWRIMRKTVQNGIERCEYPFANDGFCFAWDERNNYTYSR